MPPSAATGEVLEGLWRFVAVHPEWVDESDGWDPEVAWWAVRTGPGLVLVDPLVTEWDGLDRLVEYAGGCAAIVRTLHWHERTIAEAAERYDAGVWARPVPPGVDGPGQRHLDHPVADGETIPGGLVAHDLVRDDEIALRLPDQRALLFGDLLIRDPAGALSLCPDHWIERAGGAERMRRVLRGLPDLGLEHVLVAHGPLVLGDGRAALTAVIAGPA
jgi:hypothetical protein